MKLFISYARIDVYKIFEVIEILKVAKFDPWWDDQIDPGDDWKEELRMRIEACDAFIYIMSPDSVSAEWCIWELNKASELSKPIIPILIRNNTEIPESLKDLNYLNAIDGLKNRKVAQLVAKIFDLKQKVSTKTSFEKKPKGFPSRLKRSLDQNYKTVSESYFEPLTEKMKIYDYKRIQRKMAFDNHGYIIGIDFGTSVSSVSVIRHKRVELIPTEIGQLSVPTAIAIEHDSKPIFGNEALKFLQEFPHRGVIEVKRLLGDYSLNGATQVITIDEVAYKPEHFVILFMEKLVFFAEEYLQSNISQVVLTTPAYFNSQQHAALNNAAVTIGLKVQRVISEPVAACLSEGMMEDELWLIYDLGGGTFDASLIELGDGVFEVLSVKGHTSLGGADFDRKLVNHCIEIAKTKYLVDLKDEIVALMRIRTAVEKAKIILSSEKKTIISVPSISLSNQEKFDFNLEIDRAEYNDIVKDLIDVTIELSMQAIYDAHCELSLIDKVFVVGRASRGAGIIKSLRDIFGNRVQLASDHVVAIGAGLQAGVLTGNVKDVLLLDILSRSIRLGLQNNLSTPIALRNTTIPYKIRKRYLKIDNDVNKPLLNIRLLEGESVWSNKNDFLYEIQVPISNDFNEFELELDIDANHSLIVSILSKDGKKLESQRVELRYSDKRGRELFNSEKAILPIFEKKLGDYSSKLNRNKKFLLRWTSIVSASIIIDEYRDEKSFNTDSWANLIRWLKSNPESHVPPAYLKEMIFIKFPIVRELVIDCFEVFFNSDLSILRVSSSIDSLINRLAEIEKLW